MYRAVPAVLVTAVCCSAALQAQPADNATPGVAVVTRTEALWSADVPGALGAAAADRPEVTITLPPPGRATGAALVVCPGGGYSTLMMTYEGHDIARWLNQHGVAAMVLRYRVNPYPIAQSVADGKRAMRLLRTRAPEWGLNASRLGMIGFSAGGHLAMSVATGFDAGAAAAADPVERASCRPDFLVLVYGSTTIGGGTPTSALVTSNTPPAFLVHAQTDKVVPVAESEQFCTALQRNGVAAEFLRLPTGEHGLGCGQGELWAQWQTAAVTWLAGQGLARRP
jgi:acetyl esterase/lipase